MVFKNVIVTLNKSKLILMVQLWHAVRVQMQSQHQVAGIGRQYHPTWRVSYYLSCHYLVSMSLSDGGGRLSQSRGVLYTLLLHFMPETIYCSGCHDKHNCLWLDSFLARDMSEFESKSKCCRTPMIFGKSEIRRIFIIFSIGFRFTFCCIKLSFIIYLHQSFAAYK